MGYITAHTQRWIAKWTASTEEKEQLQLLLNRPPEWHTRANKRVRRFTAMLGYDPQGLQTSEEWLTEFEATLLKVEYWSERRTILQLNTLGQRRAELILIVLFLFGQHARFQFLGQMKKAAPQEDGLPFEELRGNHHNLDHWLMRIACHLCGYQDDRRPPKNGMLARLVQEWTGRYLGPGTGDDNITPNRVARWAQMAETAAGVARRDVERIRKTWIRTKGSASKHLWGRGCHHLRQAWAAKAPATTWTFLLFCACDAYGIYYMCGWLHRLLHF